MMDYQSEFCKIMNENANHQRVGDVFRDWSRAVSLALEKAVCKLTFDDEGANRCESEYAAIEKRYPGFNTWSGEALGITVEALSQSREEFLGHSLEDLGMGNNKNGQFFTPNCVAKVMSEIAVDEQIKEHVDGKIVRIGDEACGASVTLIAGAEKLMLEGVPQRDIFIVAADIDQLSCDISYIQFTYLGYAAVVKHQDSIALRTLSANRRTIGYYLHGMNYRLEDK